MGHRCHVVGTCGGEEKVAVLRQLGCDRIIDHTVEDVGSVLKREYLAGVDLVYEGTYASPIRTVHHTAPADQRPSSGCSGVRHVSALACQ